MRRREVVTDSPTAGGVKLDRTTNDPPPTIGGDPLPFPREGARSRVSNQSANLTEAAERALAAARVEARQLGSPQTCTEHLVLALAGDEEGVGPVLTSLGAGRETILRSLLFVFGAGPGATGDPPLSPRVERVIERAAKDARRRGSTAIGPDHLLLAILAEGGRGLGLLVLSGVGPQRLRDQMVRDNVRDLTTESIDDLSGTGIGDLV